MWGSWGRAGLENLARLFFDSMENRTCGHFTRISYYHSTLRVFMSACWKCFDSAVAGGVVGDKNRPMPAPTPIKSMKAEKNA